MRISHVQADQGDRSDIGASHITITHSSDGICTFEERTDPGGGPPLHVHPDADELFRVLDGRFRFYADGETFEAGPGDLVTVPRGVPHTFVNLGTERGHLFIIFSPGGPEAFFRTFAAKNLRIPDDMEEIGRLGASTGTELLGPNPLVEGQG